MKQRFYRAAILFLVVALLTSCSGNTQSTDRDSSSSHKETAAEDSRAQQSEKTAESENKTDKPESKEISVAGLSLMSHTPYTVYLEPTETCVPLFTPIYVTLEFDSATFCHLTYQGETVGMGRFDNKKYIDMFTTVEDSARQLAINGKCDTDCKDADFAIRVSSFVV